MEKSYKNIPDRISALPDCLLLHILSLLPFRNAVRTSCLSTRWKHLWESVPNLDFTDAKTTILELIRVINKVLRYHEGFPIKQFKVCAECDLCQATYVNSWINFVVGHQIEELFLDCTPHRVHNEAEDFQSYATYELPQCVFECESLEALTLKYCKIDLPCSVCIPFLKTLHIGNAELAVEVLKNLLNGCPMLKDLTLENCNRWRDLHIVASNSNLESLSIYELYDDSHTELIIDAPHLLSLTFSGEPKRSTYEGKNLLSLVYVNFDLDFNSDLSPEWKFEDLPFWEFIDDFCHVEVMKLNVWSAMSISVREIFDLGNPVSRSIRTLELKTRFKQCEFPGLVYMLNSFVNLELLVIDVVEDSTTDFEKHLAGHQYIEATYWRPNEYCFPRQLRNLKNIKIHGFMGSIPMSSKAKSEDPEYILHERETEFEFVKFLLKNLTALETMTIVPAPVLNELPMSSAVLFKIGSRLLDFPKSSPHVQIVFNSSCC